MAYSDFTLDRLIQEFGVEVQGERSMFGEARPVTPSPWLVEALQRANNTGFGSEKSRSERLVSPILLELSNQNQDAFAILSGANLDIDPSHGLNGECDFILSFTRLQDLIRAPVFCITEAKKQDVELGTAQCAAQLLGAARLNEREKKVIPTLYGCCTTGVEWRFLRFENSTFTLDETRYLISNLPKLLGVLQQIIDWQKFALQSMPLEGAYVTDALPCAPPSGEAKYHGMKFYEYVMLRFCRDGSFQQETARVQVSGKTEPAGGQSFAKTKQWQIFMGGGYTVVGKKVVLHFRHEEAKFSSENFDSVGVMTEEGHLQVGKWNGHEPLVFKKIIAE